MSIVKDTPGISLADQPALDTTKKFPGNLDEESRYSPFVQISGAAAGIEQTTRNGKRRLRLKPDPSATSVVRYWLKYEKDEFDDRPGACEVELAGFEAVFNAAGLGTLDVVEWRITDADGGAVDAWVVRITSTGTVLRRRASGGLSNVSFSAGISSGTEVSLRFVYTPATSVAAQDGTIQVWMMTGDAVVDDARGNTPTWTKVVDTTHSGGLCDRPPCPFWDDSAAAINSAANAGVYVGSLASYADRDTPVAASSGAASWTRIHRMQIEKATPRYRPSTGKAVFRVTVRHAEELLPAGTTRNARLRAFASLADMQAGSNVVATSDGSYAAITADAEGYYRRTLVLDGLDPDTTYWIEVQSQLNDGSGEYFMRSGTGGLFEYAVLRTPAAPGTPHAAAVRFYPDGCANQRSRYSRSKLSVLAQRIADAADFGRLHAHCPLGDLLGGGYMDEHLYDKAGVELEGAQTAQAMANAAANIQHGYWMLALHSVCSVAPQRDDHDGPPCNDASTPELLADGSTNPWYKSGRPNPVGTGTTEYTITPRELAELGLAHSQRWIYDTLWPEGEDTEMDAARFHPAATDYKYGTTPFDADDFGYYYLDWGMMRVLSWDTRGTARDMNDNDNATLTGIAKTWVSSAIRAAGSGVRGIVHLSPAYVVGFVEAGGTLKDGDIQYASNADVPALLTERTLHYVTDMDASDASWGLILSSDHHFSSVSNGLSTLSLSAKMLRQIADGGCYSICQDPAGLGTNSASLYAFLSNFGLTSGVDTMRSVTTVEITDERTGAHDVLIESVDAGVNTEHSASYAGVALPTIASSGRTLSIELPGMDGAQISGFEPGKGCTVAVTSEGFDASGVLGTVSRTVETRFLSASGSSPATVVLGLSEPVYDDDLAGGAGTSGADPLVTLDAGAFDDGSVTSGALDAVPAVNGSALDYPKAIARWAMPPQIIFGADYSAYFGFQSADGRTAYLEADAFQMYGIACVKFTLTDGSAPQTHTATSWTRSRENVPAWKTGGTWLYRAELPVTGMANGVLTADFSAYPVVGDENSVRHTSDGVWPTAMLTTGCSYKFWNNEGASGTPITPVFAYYDPAAGGPGVASVTEATAQASPFPDLWDALDAAGAASVAAGNPAETGGDTASGVIIKCAEGSLCPGNYDTARVVTSHAWCIITAAPGAAKANVRFDTQGNANGLRTNRIMWHGVSFEQGDDGVAAGNYNILRCASNGAAGSDTSQGLWLKGCDWLGNYSLRDPSETEHLVATGFNWLFFTDCASRDTYNGFAGRSPFAVLARNCYVEDADSDSYSLTRLVLDCELQGSVSISGAHPDIWQVVSTTGDINAIVRDLKAPNHYNQTLFNNGNDCSNIAFVNFLTERVGNPLGGFGQWLDCTGSHFLWWHGSHPGQGYAWNDTGAADQISNVSIRNCVWSDVSIADTGGGYAGLAAGCGVRDNHVVAAGHDLVGFGSITTGDAGFADDQSRDATDGGGGDYAPVTGSALTGRLTTAAQLIVPRDLYGNERTVLNNTVGALLVQPTPAAGVSPRGVERVGSRIGERLLRA